MKKLFIFSISLLVLFGLAACSTSPAETPVVEEPVVENPVVEEPVVEEPVVEEPVVEEATTVEITDIHGTIEVPFNPERVISSTTAPSKPSKIGASLWLLRLKALWEILLPTLKTIP